MSTDVEVWTTSLPDVESLLPSRSNWGNWEKTSATCWQFDNEGQRWTLTVCRPETVADSEIPEEVQRLVPDAKFRVGLSLEPSAASKTGFAFMDDVMATIAAASGGLYFDSFTAEPHVHYLKE